MTVLPTVGGAETPTDSAPRREAPGPSVGTTAGSAGGLGGALLLGEHLLELLLLLVAQVGLDQDHLLAGEALFHPVHHRARGQHEQRGGSGLDLLAHPADERVVDA